MPMFINQSLINCHCYGLLRPGGQLKFLNAEQDDYDRQDRNTCSCPDDQRWYMAAIKHLDTIVEITVIF